MAKKAINIRKARVEDTQLLVEFTAAEAKEAATISVNLERLQRGVARALEDPALAQYWIVEDQDQQPLASMSVVKEWSDWQAGFYWWLQSVYIDPRYRGQGILKSMIDFLNKLMRAESGLQLNLYVDKHNHQALKAYRKIGFSDSDYQILSLQCDKSQ